MNNFVSAAILRKDDAVELHLKMF